MSISSSTAAGTAESVEGAARRAVGWTVAGVVAGLAGIVGIQASGGVTAVYDESLAGNPVAIAARLAEQRPAVVVEHVGFAVAALALLVFAAGLARHLTSRLEPGSLLGPIAAGGLIVTSTICLIGTGLTTELVFGLSEGTDLVPEFAVVGAHWLGTIPWLWAAAGVSALAVAIASLRHGATPRWLGWASLVLGGLTALFGVSPLQYMAGFTGPVWVLVCAVGLWFAGRRARS
ncbi:hypothetical protein ACFYVR_23155 [Rhodococcus sp. NPDC003318]|uniref:hypothetical protein n=1 Tax=Rhodococcus sp. NPDC003318 TaxID=3364503 RepID=UPI0036BD1007